jgi:hypothetical protein
LIKALSSQAKFNTLRHFFQSSLSIRGESVCDHKAVGCSSKKKVMAHRYLDKMDNWNKFLRNGGKVEQKRVIGYYFLRCRENLEEKSCCWTDSGKRSLYQLGL